MIKGHKNDIFIRFSVQVVVVTVADPNKRYDDSVSINTCVTTQGNTCGGGFDEQSGFEREK